MLERLSGHAATGLQDGRVLITGGMAQTGATLFKTSASAELYDPLSGKFMSTGSMSEARFLHTATLLDDGRVLLAAGLRQDGDKTDALATAEIFDPSTGTFSQTGSLLRLSGWTQATKLDDGRVLVMGFFGQSKGKYHPGAELYDPTTGRFAATGALPDRRSNYVSTLLSDGRVLVLGGEFDKIRGDTLVRQRTVSDAEVYDPKTGKFSLAGHMLHRRTSAVATLLADGRVMVVGGFSGYGAGTPQRWIATAETFNPKTRKFHSSGRLLCTNSINITATRLLNGKVLIAGLSGGDEQHVCRYAELYNPKTGRFTKSKAQPGSTYGSTSTLLLDGRVLFTGGSVGNGIRVETATLYQP